MDIIPKSIGSRLVAKPGEFNPIAELTGKAGRQENGGWNEDSWNHWQSTERREYGNLDERGFEGCRGSGL
jgi:hypothetical protein